MKPDTKASIDRYATQHIPTGGFLAAVLANDLFDALASADTDNAATLTEIAEYIYRTVPGHAYGSREAVRDWLQMRVVDTAR